MNRNNETSAVSKRHGYDAGGNSFCPTMDMYQRLSRIQCGQKRSHLGSRSAVPNALHGRTNSIGVMQDIRLLGADYANTCPLKR